MACCAPADLVGLDVLRCLVFAKPTENKGNVLALKAIHVPSYLKLLTVNSFTVPVMRSCGHTGSCKQKRITIQESRAAFDSFATGRQSAVSAGAPANGSQCGV